LNPTIRRDAPRIIPRFAALHELPQSKSPMVPPCSGTFRQKFDIAWNTPTTAPNELGGSLTHGLVATSSNMEMRWLSLARSYQFVDQLIASTSDDAQQRGALSERLELLRIRMDQIDANRLTKS
jgi:hypothetical protein